MSFDYPNTCPTIDKSINSAKREIRDFIFRILDENGIPPEDKSIANLTDEYFDQLWYHLEDTYESVRTTNTKMRDAAEKQIHSIEVECEDHIDEIKQLESIIRTLEEDVRDLEKQVYALENL